MRRFSGTSPRTILWASPSAMAVLPVPGSPMSIGLFFVRRLRICNTRRISSSRPITGSSLPARARSLRFIAYFDSALYVSSAPWSVAFLPLRSSSMAASSSFRPRPASLSMVAAGELTSKIASNKASSVTYSSPIFLAVSRAFCSTSFELRLRYGSCPDTLGRADISASTCRCTAEALAPIFWKMKLTTVSPSSITPLSRHTGSMACVPAARVISTAFCMASCDLMVKLLKFIICNS